jgi:hypothetical protein
MTIVDTTDPRFTKAVLLSESSGQWLKLRSKNGRPLAYGVPSQRTPGHYYLVTQTSCTCQDATRHAHSICKHTLAVQIHCARVAGKPMPASNTVDGLQHMVDERQSSTPFPAAVRVDHDEIAWQQPATLDRIVGKRRPIYDTDQRTLANRYNDVVRFMGD